MARLIVMVSRVAQMVKCLPEMWRLRFDPWVGKIPWRRKRQPIPVLLPGKSTPMDGGAWQAIVHGVTKSQTRLSNFSFSFKAYIFILCSVFTNSLISLDKSPISETFSSIQEADIHKRPLLSITGVKM